MMAVCLYVWIVLIDGQPVNGGGCGAGFRPVVVRGIRRLW